MAKISHGKFILLCSKNRLVANKPSSANTARHSGMPMIAYIIVTHWPTAELGASRPYPVKKNSFLIYHYYY